MHIPVLLNEIIDNLNITPDGTYVDCTGGGGGHASAVLEKLGENGRLIVLDRDVDAVKRLNDKFEADNRVTVVHANFSDVAEVLERLEVGLVDGLYADFGVSSFQLQIGERGFSFRRDGLLDMRMDTTQGISAAEVVNTFSFDNIAQIIWKYGEEKFSKRIANDIVKHRVLKPFTTTLELAEVIKQAVPKKFHKKGIHPATQSFQAIRIYVNGELEAIFDLMKNIDKLLKTGGRFLAISFHSLEDRIVKEALVEYAKECVCPPRIPVCVCGKRREFKLITRKPIIPTDSEVTANPLSRSAKLRVAERV